MPEQEILPHRKVRHDSLARRSSATKPSPARTASDGRRGANALAPEENLSALPRAEAEDRLESFRSPCADESS